MSSNSGVIVRGIGGFYFVWDGSAERTLRAQRKFRHDRITPMVGDRVEFEPDGESGWVTRVLPRKNALTRPPIANVDALVIVCAASNPQPDLALVDKLMVFAEMNSIKVRLAVNKSDADWGAASAIARQYAKANVEPICVSALTGLNVSELKRSLAGLACAFTGQSGAGKSSLINAMFALSLETGALSRRAERGKNTTRKSEIILTDDCMVFDTPGFSLLEAELMEPMRLSEYYPEFAGLAEKCRFQPCAHLSEPGCEVRRAVEAGEIDPERYARYALLMGEIREKWNGRYN